jgi:hypothetical protein
LRKDKTENKKTLIFYIVGCIIVICLHGCAFFKKGVIKKIKETEDVAFKLKCKTIDEHTEKYLVEERKGIMTVSQRQKELSDNFEKKVKKGNELFKKAIEKK